jgi:hypothetical protein
MIRKLTALAAALVLLATMAGGAATTSSAATASAASVLPYEGPYMGMDAHHRTITFSYSRSRGMYDFRVNHHLIGGAHVAGGMWHHTCHNGYCTRAQWHHDFYVTGYWNNASGGGDVFFEANAIAY